MPQTLEGLFEHDAARRARVATAEAAAEDHRTEEEKAAEADARIVENHESTGGLFSHGSGAREEYEAAKARVTAREAAPREAVRRRSPPPTPHPHPPRHDCPLSAQPSP